ncbi:hypothetical protein SDJN02_05934, partial [Cucurbita argyrosperma subsp. argyrosperma]
MKQDYRLEPSMDQYSAMVNLLGRDGKIKEVEMVRSRKPEISPRITILNKNNGEEKASRNSCTTHAQSKRIYAFQELRDETKVAGYVPNTSSIHDVEDDVQEQQARHCFWSFKYQSRYYDTRPKEPTSVENATT